MGAYFHIPWSCVKGWSDEESKQPIREVSWLHSRISLLVIHNLSRVSGIDDSDKHGAYHGVLRPLALFYEQVKIVSRVALHPECHIFAAQI